MNTIIRHHVTRNRVITTTVLVPQVQQSWETDRTGQNRTSQSNQTMEIRDTGQYAYALDTNLPVILS